MFIYNPPFPRCSNNLRMDVPSDQVFEKVIVRTAERNPGSEYAALAHSVRIHARYTM